MVSLEPYLTYLLAEAVGWALLHSLWQGALVALLLAGVVALLRSPQLRYLAGCAALLVLAVSPLGTGALLYEGVRPVPPIQSGEAAGTLPTPAPTENVAAPTERTSSPASPLASQTPVVSWGARVLALLETAAPHLAGVWLVGVGVLLLRLAGQALYVHRFRARHQTPADAHWQVRARTLAARLGVRRPWQLMQSSRADTPLTCGVLRPLIVLPTSALTGMPAAQLEALLAHELAHIKRHDYLVNLFQCVVEALLFYHPAAWWVSSTVRRAREECCDDASVAVCGDAKLYARALTNLEALRQPPALALAATDKPLLARVKRLLGLEETRYTPPLATGVLLLSIVAVTAVLSLSPHPVAAQNADESNVQGSLWVSVSSGVVFDDAYTRINELVTPAPYVLVEERTATEKRAVRVTRGSSNTDFVYAYTADGVVRPFSAQARAWFDASLQAAVLEPLKEDAAKKAQGVKGKDVHLVSHLDYDHVVDRYISFALADDAHLEPSSMSTIENSLGKRNLLSQVTHYAAHNLVSDSEIGNYLKLFIERSRPTQLEALTPEIVSTVAELEDEAVKADVKQALATRLQNTAGQQERVARQITAEEVPTASPPAPEAPKQDSLLEGVVVWQDERGFFIKVEHREEPEDSKTLRRVKVRGIGVSTVLPTDWQQTSPGVFEYLDAEGGKISLTFEKQPLAEVSFEADTISIMSLPRYAGRDWESLLLQDGQDSSLKLTTEEGNSTYLVTVEGGEEQASLSVESYLDGLIPTMLRKFKLDGQP